jgi:hypothetical protein
MDRRITLCAVRLACDFSSGLVSWGPRGREGQVFTFAI